MHCVSTVLRLFGRTRNETLWNIQIKIRTGDIELIENADGIKENVHVDGTESIDAYLSRIYM